MTMAIVLQVAASSHSTYTQLLESFQGAKLKSLCARRWGSIVSLYTIALHRLVENYSESGHNILKARTTAGFFPLFCEISSF